VVSDNFAEFAAGLDQAAAKALDRANMVKRRIALELLKKIIERTPVRTGRLRGNWQASLNGRASGEIEIGRKVRTGERISEGEASAIGTQAIIAGSAVIGRVRPGEDIYLTNNLPYTMLIEKGGSQKQAPAGMVAVSLAEIRAARLL